MSYENSLDELRIERTISTLHGAWNFQVNELANEKGITAKLQSEIFLDWSDVLNVPEEARMHMYPSRQEDASLGVKRVRMETWQAAIVLFDDMMEAVPSPLTARHLKELLHHQKLPRPQRVVLPTTNPSLIRLFDALGIWENEADRKNLITGWASFAELARQGAIVQPKKFLREKQSHY